MEIKLRLEEERDYRRVEELTREAFWNVYTPGCSEHLLLHNLRTKQQFIKELAFIALDGNLIVGNIAYAEGRIVTKDGATHKIVTFGPLSVLPEYQNKGIGGKLIKHTAQLAKEMGYPAILIYGDPEYYQRFGFKVSKEYNITNTNNQYPAAMLVWELVPHALKDIMGAHQEENCYAIDENELEEYDKTFPTKEKLHTQTQDRFLELVNKVL